MSIRAPAPVEGLHPAATASGQVRAAEVRRLFAGIARRYDIVNRVASARMDVSWRKRTARALALGPGQWCLDVCCGTADLALAVADSGARVVGVDFCRPMLAEARRKRLEAHGICVLEADALALPLATASVDAACVAFGLRNVADPAAALREMRRVVRPGGKVAVLEFSSPGSRLARAAYRVYSRRLLPLLGDLVSGKWGTYRYLPQTIGRWLSPEELGRLFREADLIDVSWRSMTFGVAVLHVGRVPSPAAGHDTQRRSSVGPC